MRHLFLAFVVFYCINAAPSNNSTDLESNRQINGCSGRTNLKVLLVGNSYTYFNSLGSMVKNVAQKQGYTLTVTTKATGGAWLYDHALDANQLTQNQYDIVVMQEQSILPALSYGNTGAYINYAAEYGYPSARHLSDAFRQKGACRIIFFETWGRRDDNTNSMCNNGFSACCKYDEMQTRLRESYETMAYQTGSEVAPVGEAFRLIKEDNESRFRGLYAGDGSHPSQRGSYVAAMTIAQTITGKSVSGLSYVVGGASWAQSFVDDAVQNEGPWDFSGYTGNDPCPQCDPYFSVGRAFSDVNREDQQVHREIQED